VADILNIGASALLSLQRAISTTGNNIANANTPGYSRQRVDFATTPAERAGNSFLGTGVKIAGIERAFNQFLVTDVQNRSSASAGLSLRSDLTSRLDGLLADPAVGVSPALDSFFGALQGVANNPGSLPERQVLLSEAEGLALRFRTLEQQFQQFNDEVSGRIETGVSEINGLARSIADLNLQISQASASQAGSAPNDLLDARDLALQRLAEKVSVTVVPRNDGAVNVMVGNGQSLVVGSEASALGTVRDRADGSRTNIVLAGSPAQGDIGRFISGGEVGAALSFRSDVLDSSRRELDVLAAGVATTINAQHRQGIGLNGAPGGNFFQLSEPAVTADGGNTGSASLSVAIDDPGALTGADYRLEFDGAQWSISNLQTGAATAVTGSSAIVDGLQFNFGGSPASGDGLRVQPLLQAAGNLRLAISDPADVAAAGPLRATVDPANLGSGALSSPEATAGASLPLGAALTLTFDPDALGAGQPGFLVAGGPGGPIAFDPAVDAEGKSVTLGDLSFTLTGQPVAGDSFVIADNVDGAGDNRNALALAELQTERILGSGTASYQDAYGGLVASVAVASRQASSEADVAAVLLNQAVAASDSVQGVNLDEEAANLLRYQQAYQAAAQVISVADTVFQTLLSATRR